MFTKFTNFYKFHLIFYKLLQFYVLQMELDKYDIELLAVRYNINGNSIRIQIQKQKRILSFFIHRNIN